MDVIQHFSKKDAIAFYQVGLNLVQ